VVSSGDSAQATALKPNTIIAPKVINWVFMSFSSFWAREAASRPAEYVFNRRATPQVA
jgi:hypothetical protein